MKMSLLCVFMHKADFFWKNVSGLPTFSPL